MVFFLTRSFVRNNNRKIISRPKSRMDLIPKLSVLSDSKYHDSRDHFTLFSRISPEEPDSAQNCRDRWRHELNRPRSKRGFDPGSEFDRHHPRPPYLHEKQYRIRKNTPSRNEKFPPPPHALTHARNRQTIGKRSLIFSSPSPLLLPTRS